MFNKKKSLLASAAVCALILAGCSGSDEDLKPLGEPKSGEESQNNPSNGSENPRTESEGIGSAVGDEGDDGLDLEGRPSHRLEPEDKPPPDVASRPANMSSQRWWIEGDVMRWWFGNQTDFSISPEMWLSIWSDPNNSDVGSPEVAADLAAAAEVVAQQWLSTPSSSGVRGATAPASGITIQNVSTAIANRFDEGPQLYRAAVLWSADEDPEFRQPIFNQMIEMYFVGGPGNWSWVRCADVDPQLCVPIFQQIL